MIVASDLIELRDIGSSENGLHPGVSPIALSPDGSSMAFVINQADLAQNTYCRALVTAPLDGGEPRIVDRGGEYVMITDVLRGLFAPTGGGAMIVPAWSTDGQWIGYLKRVDGVTQLWRVRADGSAASAITKLATDVESWAWSTGGKMLFTTRSGVTAANQALDREALGGYHYDARVATMTGLRPQLREADVPPASFVIDVESGVIRAATPAEAALLPLRGDSTAAVITSSDGRHAGAAVDKTSPLKQRRIWGSDTAGRRVTCSAAACSDGLVQFWWSDKGDLVFLRREGWGRGDLAIYRWSPGPTAPRRVLTSPDWLLGCLYRTERLICTAETSASPRRIVSIDLATGKSRTLFDPNPVFAKLDLGTVERIRTRNDIGLEAWSDLVLPPGYKPGHKLPMVVVQYRSQGFLRGGTGNDYPIFLLAAHGFAVLSVERPPVFGSNRPDLDTFDKLITAMTQDWAERKSILSSLLAGVDQAVAKGNVDPARVGITGLSDGISTAEYALINTRRFAAAAISSCCEDPKTVMTYGGIAWADWNREVRKYPLASQDGTSFWKAMSFAVNARTLNTPILMQLADREYLGGLEAFTALREQKNPVDLRFSRRVSRQMATTAPACGVRAQHRLVRLLAREQQRSESVQAHAI